MTPVQFKIWDETNAQKARATRKELCVNISVKRGRMYFSTSAAELLHLTKDSRVLFLEGQGDSPTLFVSKAKGRGLPVRIESKGKSGKHMYCYVCAGQMIEHLGEVCRCDSRMKVRMSAIPETLPQGEGLPAGAYRLYINESMVKS